MSYSVFPTIFPENFTWGAATASYQIEGAVNEAGRGLSIWDTFSHLPGTTANGDTGDVACDHYHRWQSDVKLMADLGMQSYRFSIAWSRVIPNGTGAVNEAGLDFYDQLVNGLLAANITPWVTLYHWDLPQALQDNGGWANRDTVNAFVAYSDLVVRRLGDRVKHWITHNEPWVVSFAGNYQGRHAPGIRDLPTALQVSHNLLLSHGLAVPVIRAASHEAQVGITLNFSPARPASAAPEDIAAAKLHDGYVNRWFLDPLYGHGYPADMVALYGAAMHDIGPNDLEQIAVLTDFLGANYYYPGIVRHVETDVNPLGFAPISSKELAVAGYELTEMGWPIVPDAFTNLLTRLHSDYNPGAIYITENGAAFDDQVENGTVHDAQRIAYLYGHLKAVKDAITAGVPVKGYFVWSLLDNFEWALGYGKRFGIVYIDYKTQARIPKASAEWYRRVIAAHAVVDATESA